MRVEKILKVIITEKDWVVCPRCSYTTKSKLNSKTNNESFFIEVGHCISELIYDLDNMDNSENRLSFVGLNCPVTNKTIIYEPINNKEYRPSKSFK
jgi:hypothetical protein